MARTTRELTLWLTTRDGIDHRQHLLDAGFPVALVRAFVRSGAGRMIRRGWVAVPSADPELVTAAEAAGRLTCLTLARRRRWWIPEGLDASPHVHKLPNSGSALRADAWPGTLHWTRPLAAAPGRTLLADPIDALAHIAVCQPRETALVLWESALTVEQMSAAALRRIPWTSIAARELAESVCGLSDSGLETLLADILRPWGLPVQQQAWIAGHFVDLLIGARLVVQIDGYEYHADGSAQRTRDLALDAELQLRGYTVLHFSYEQIVRRRGWVVRTIRAAIAQGKHLA